MTEDPARSGLNWYTYCNNNPIIFIDPSGLVAVGLKDYAETYKGSTISVKNNIVTVSWNDLSFSRHVSQLTENEYDHFWSIDDSVFVNAFGIGDQKLLVYQDATTGNVSIRAGFNISGDAASKAVKTKGLFYKTHFLQGIEEHWSGSFGDYEVSTYAREYSEGITVNINDKLGVSNMRSGLFGWSTKSPGKITMYTGDSRGDGSLYTVSQFRWVSAHEFGHILGVADMYTNASYAGTSSIFNGYVGEFGVQGRDIAKVLTAWSTGKWQKW